MKPGRFFPTAMVFWGGILIALSVVVNPMTVGAVGVCDRFALEDKDRTLLEKQIGEAAAAGFSAGETDSLAVRCLEGGLTARQTARVFTLLIRAREAGLPEKVILNKLYEGLAKRVDPAAVVKVVGTRALNLRTALEMVKEASSGNLDQREADLIILVADFLEMGKNRSEIAEALRTLYNQEGKIDVNRLEGELRR